MIDSTREVLLFEFDLMMKHSFEYKPLSIQISLTPCTRIAGARGNARCSDIKYFARQIRNACHRATRRVTIRAAASEVARDILEDVRWL